MRRLMFLAIGLSALLWTAAARPAAVAAGDIVKLAPVGSNHLDGDSQGTGGSDYQWRAPQHTIAAVTESIWKSAPIHAALATTPSAHSVNSMPAPSSPDPPVRPALPYLRHTPLLI